MDKVSKYVSGIGCISIKRLGACMRSWVHVYKTAGCMYAELGACLKNGWVHVCGVGCMSIKRLGACSSLLLAFLFPGLVRHHGPEIQ